MTELPEIFRQMLMDEAVRKDPALCQFALDSVGKLLAVSVDSGTEARETRLLRQRTTYTVLCMYAVIGGLAVLTFFLSLWGYLPLTTVQAEAVERLVYGAGITTVVAALGLVWKWKKP